MKRTFQMIINSIHWTKVRGIQMVAQGGKTRKMEEQIRNCMELARREGLEDDVNIVLSSNNKLLVEQTAGRFNERLGPPVESDSESTSSEGSDDGQEYILKNGATSWTSSTGLSVADIVLSILENECDMVIGCAHPARLRKLFGKNGVVERLVKNRHFSRRINIWIDEAHLSIRLWSKYLDILKHDAIKNFILVTATWDPIDKHFKVPRILREETHPKVYRRLAECCWVTLDPDHEEEIEETDEASPFDTSYRSPRFLRQVLNDTTKREETGSITLAEWIEQPGKIWLAFGDTRTESHDEIERILLHERRDKNWSGLKLNGKGKDFLTIHGKVLNYNEYNSRREEPHAVLARAFEEFPSLLSGPFFITGLRCLKEGLTFQSEKVMINGETLPDMANPTEAYQACARTTGNVKAMTWYKHNPKALIITTPRMQKMILRQENINVHLNDILRDAGRLVPTELDKRRAARGHIEHDPRGIGYRVFNKRSSAIGHLKARGLTTRFGDRPNGVDPYNGLYICSIQSNRGAKQQPRYLTEAIDKVDLATGGNGAHKTLSPCYLDPTVASPILVWVTYIAPDEEKEDIEKADKDYFSEEVQKILIKHATPYRED